MFFVTKIKDGTDPHTVATKIQINARRRIFLFPMRASEVQLDKYIRQKFKTSLKLLCLQLALKANYNTNTKDEVIVTFVDKKFDDLASLITYGTGKIPGSKILKFALRG